MAKRFIGNVKGVGVSDFSWEYYLSSSSAVLDGGSWSATPPTLGNNKYLWMRSKVTLTDGTIQYTTPVCEGVWEEIYGIYAIGDKVDGALSDVTDLKSRMTAEESKVQPIAKGGTGATTAEAARESLGLSKYADLNPETLIPSGADLNTYTTPGTYLSQNKTISASLTNCPHTTSGFTLLVMQVASSDYRQILIANSAACLVYMRHFNASNTFDSWIQSGTVTIKKVWTNASPTSTFGPQKITITDDDYDAIDMVFLFSTNYAQTVGTMRIWLNTTRRHILNATWGSNATRGIAPSKSGGKIVLNVETGNNYLFQSTGGSANSNSYAIPLEAYGVKGVV